MSSQPDIYLAATGTWIAPTVAVTDATDQGLVPETHQNLGFTDIAVADIAGPEMAVLAARAALAKTSVPASDIGLVLHATHWFQGLDLWPSASYVANEAVGPHPTAFDLQQQSLGGLSSFRLAVAHLQSGMSSAALITTGDNYASPGIDRWSTLPNIIFGDAGTAVVLSTEGGFAKVLSTAAGADHSLERSTRGTTEFAKAPGSRQPVPVIERMMQYMGLPEAAGAWERYEAELARVHNVALTEANLDIKEITRVVVPFLHRGGGQAENYDVLGYTAEQSLWEYGATVGHLGSGDHVAGLDHLVETDALQSGDRVMLIGAGIGFSFSAAVIEIL